MLRPMFAPRSLLSSLALSVAVLACKAEVPDVPSVEALEQKAEALKKEAEAAARAAEQAAAKAHEDMGDPAEAAPAAGPEALQAKLAKFQAAMKGAIEQTVEPVPFRELKALLPETIEGFERVDSGGQTSGAGGVKASVAQAKFEGPDGARLHLKISDMGSMRAFAALAATGWMAVEIDKENEAGYERTGTFEGFRSFETYRKSGERGELKLIVADRFMVEVDGRKTKMETVRSAAKQIGLSELAGKKDFGVKKVDRAEE